MIRGQLTGWAPALAALLVVAALAHGAQGGIGHSSLSLYPGTILIDGNGNFTAANGVVSGSGTPSDPYVIAGWTIDASSGTGIQIRGTNASFVLRDVVVTNGSPTEPGVWLQGLANGRLFNVTSMGNRYGIVIQNSDNVSVVASQIRLNDYDGIAVTNSTDVMMERNVILDNGLYGVHVLDSLSANLTGNAVGGNGYLSAAPADVFFEGAPRAVFADNRVVSSGSSGLYLSASPNAVIHGNAFANHTFAVFVDASDSTRILGNSFTANSNGLYVHSEAVLASDNVFQDNAYGIYVFERGNSTIEGNRFSALGGVGILLWGSEGDRLRGNQFNYTGILLEGTAVGHFDSHTISLDNLVNGRPVRYYRDCGGLSVDGQPTGELLVANCTAFRASNLTIGQTAAAVGLAYVKGATLDENLLWGSYYGLRLIQSTGIVAIHNAFVLNAFQVGGIEGETWDAGYPRGGNYWSDYGGADDCSGPAQNICPDEDSIGDAPYTVSQAGVDHYPLMRPYNAAPLPLIARFAVMPASADSSAVFTFNASASADPNGPDSAIRVRWDFDGDGVWDTDWSNAKTASHVFAEPGTYEVRLEIAGSLGLIVNTTREVVVQPVRFLGLEIPVAIVVLSGAGFIAAVAAYFSFRRLRKRRELRQPGFGMLPRGRT